MADTVGRLSPQQQQRMLEGIDLDGKPAQPWETPPILDAGGGLHSTANDMVRWMKWHLSNARQGAEARTLAHALYRPNDGLKSAVGIEADSADGIDRKSHTSELQSLMRISYAVFCLKKKKQ